jgi:hypothetical protein
MLGLPSMGVGTLGNGTPILRWDRNTWEPSPAFRICFGAEEKTLPQHDALQASLRRGFFCTEKGALNSSSRRPQSLEISGTRGFASSWRCGGAKGHPVVC